VGNPLRDSRGNLLAEITVTAGYLHELVSSAFLKQKRRLKRELTTGK